MGSAAALSSYVVGLAVCEGGFCVAVRNDEIDASRNALALLLSPLRMAWGPYAARGSEGLQACNVLGRHNAISFA